ncbi:hypothetical protein F5Y17DRAFT_468689 [Xylariaceae sp. FL0594]|nr:hypothetical protein F5Y17DRAFT_468689 [Xylariaceae sp. FL0594]
MKVFTAALCATAAAAASLPVAGRQQGLPLSDFEADEFPALTPEQIAAGEDKMNVDFALSQRGEPGWPLSVFPEVPHLSLDQIRKYEDLGHNNFSRLPVFGPGHHHNLQSFLDESRRKIGHEVHFLADKIQAHHGHVKDAWDDLIGDIRDDIHDFLEPRDTGDCANPHVRIEWDNYSSSDKKAFISAIQCMIKAKPSGKFTASKNRYEDFVRLHQTYAPSIHSDSTSVQTHKFLLWHRYYLWAFEQVLRDECGFNRAMPWWDEKKWAGKFSQSTLFTDQWFGRLTGPSGNSATCLTTGPFAGLTSSLGPGQTTNNPHCVQRAVDERMTADTGVNTYNACLSRTNYPEFHSCVEFSFHAQGHNGVGGTMRDKINSPGDPAFFMHHSYVDYVFRKWQNGNISRRTTISGCAANNGCPPLTLDTMVYIGGICGKKCPNLPVRDVLRTLQGHFCYKYNY